jgi:hypothetical protein
MSMATKGRAGGSRDPIAFLKKRLAMLERGALGDVEKVKANLRRRLKLAREQMARSLKKLKKPG